MANDIVSHLGGLRSQPGQIVLGYDPEDWVIVTWYGGIPGVDEQDFGFDPDTGIPITLTRGVPMPLTKTQALSAMRAGAKLISSKPLAQ